MAVPIVSVVSIFIAGMGVLGLTSPAKMVSFRQLGSDLLIDIGNVCKIHVTLTGNRQNINRQV